MHATYDVCSEFNKCWKGTVSMAISTTTKLVFAACVSAVAVVSIVKFAGAQDVEAKPSGTDFLLADECAELLREIEASNGDAESVQQGTGSLSHSIHCSDSQSRHGRLQGQDGGRARGDMGGVLPQSEGDSR